MLSGSSLKIKMTQQSEAQVAVSAFHLLGTHIRCEFHKLPSLGSIRIKDTRKQDVFRVRRTGSLVHARRELVDVNETIAVKFEKKLLTLLGGWTAYGSGSDVLFTIDDADVFPKSTLINLVCAKGVFSSKDLFLDGVLVSEGIGLAVETQGLSGPTEDARLNAITAEVAHMTAEYVRFITQAIDGTRLAVEVVPPNVLAAEAERLIAEGARLTAQVANVAHGTAEGTRLDALAIAVTRLNAEGVRLKALAVRLNALDTEGVCPTSEGAYPNMGTSLCTLAVMGSRLSAIATKNKGVPERHDAADFKFQFRGSWTGKACGMYIADTEIKIAQMRPLDDNNGEGFSVDILPNVNCEFVIASFAAVETMKNVAQKQKELLGDALCFTGRCLCGFAGNVVGGSIDVI